MSLPIFPIRLVDLFGSSLMILFSFLCVRLTRQLTKMDRSNVVWTYLLWLCYALAAFAISRSVGHILKHVLLAMRQEGWWNILKPYSGAINTLMFVVVASITLFFERTWKVYQQILEDKQMLQTTHEKLVFMNRNLENLVSERTQEVAVSERKYRRIFEDSRDMIVVVSGGGEIEDLNPAGAQMLGLDWGVDSNGHPRFAEFLADNEGWPILRKDLDRHGFVPDTEIQLRRTDDSLLSVLLSGAAERRANGDILSVHFLIKDISQRKAMEMQLLQADKLASIGQLSAGIAHEINNPLGLILGYTQLILRGQQEGTQLHADLKTIEKHARTCKTIVGDLLSFARSSRTRKDISHLHKAVDDVLGVVKHQYELDGIEITNEFDASLPDMILDEEKIRQVLMNLIMNARQAMTKGGVIKLATHYDDRDHRVVLKVSDTGCGIKPEFLSRIFDPFFTTKLTGEGTGLGLSVSYGIIKDHGGEILVESEPGKGATFTVVLPVLSAEHAE